MRHVKICGKPAGDHMTTNPLSTPLGWVTVFQISAWRPFIQNCAVSCAMVLGCHVLVIPTLEAWDVIWSGAVSQKVCTGKQTSCGDRATIRLRQLILNITRILQKPHVQNILKQSSRNSGNGQLRRCFSEKKWEHHQVIQRGKMVTPLGETEMLSVLNPQTSPIFSFLWSKRFINWTNHWKRPYHVRQAEWRQFSFLRWLSDLSDPHVKRRLS